MIELSKRYRGVFICMDNQDQGQSSSDQSALPPKGRRQRASPARTQQAQSIKSPAQQKQPLVREQSSSRLTRQLSTPLPRPLLFADGSGDEERRLRSSRFVRTRRW